METIRYTNAPNTRLTNGRYVILPGKPVNLSCQLSELDRITQKYTFTTYLFKTDELNLMIALELKGNIPDTFISLRHFTEILISETERHHLTFQSQN